MTRRRLATGAGRSGDVAPADLASAVCHVAGIARELRYTRSAHSFFAAIAVVAHIAHPLGALRAAKSALGTAILATAFANQTLVPWDGTVAVTPNLVLVMACDPSAPAEAWRRRGAARGIEIHRLNYVPCPDLWCVAGSQMYPNQINSL